MGYLESMGLPPLGHQASAALHGMWEKRVPVMGAGAACSVMSSFSSKSVAELQAHNVDGCSNGDKFDEECGVASRKMRSFEIHSHGLEAGKMFNRQQRDAIGRGWEDG